jgi:putative long chain acyl-CoA synthase
VERRFRPARVLEFYAATESSAVLVNVSGAKLGSMGRPLPGSAEVRIAAYDVAAGQYVLGRDGFVTPCGPGEIGLLLARARVGEEGSATKLRGVFERGDAWIDTGDLFRRDADGDYWRVDSLTDVIVTAAGPVFTVPIRDALGTISAVELAVAYGVVPNGEERPIVIAAVTLRPDAELVLHDLNAALRSLPREQRPQFVRVVDQIPVTTWYRPLTVSLREQGVPEPGDGRPLWRLVAAGETYVAIGGPP